MLNTKFVQKIFGKNINVGYSFPLYCKNKVSKTLSKYSIKLISYNASLEKKKYLYKVKLNIILNNHIEIESSGLDKLPYKAFNLALLNLSKKVRRHMRKKKIIRKNRQERINFKEDIFNVG